MQLKQSGFVKKDTEMSGNNWSSNVEKIRPSNEDP